MKSLSKIVLYLLFSELLLQYDFIRSTGKVSKERWYEVVPRRPINAPILQSCKTAVNGNLIDISKCFREAACK